MAGRPRRRERRNSEGPLSLWLVKMRRYNEWETEFFTKNAVVAARSAAEAEQVAKDSDEWERKGWEPDPYDAVERLTRSMPTGPKGVWHSAYSGPHDV